MLLSGRAPWADTMVANCASTDMRVHFLYHSEYDYVKTHGLQVDSVNGDFHLNNMNIYSSTSQMPPCDVVLVAMKSTQNDQLRTMLPPVAPRRSVIILVQNGLGLEQELEKAIPQNPIGGAMAFICASRIAPGHIYAMPTMVR